jgi:hypothetical protein
MTDEDEKFIEAVAQEWVIAGGDADGFIHNVGNIYDAIKKAMKKGKQA